MAKKRKATEAIDTQALRRCLGHFATGVTVVTCDDDDGVEHGATVNSFSSISLEPALVMASLDRRSRISRYLHKKPFTVNILQRTQMDTAMHFAGRPLPKSPKWERPKPDLAPQLKSALATIACKPWKQYDGGDHIMFLGEVQQFAATDDDPLVFYMGGFRQLGSVYETAPWVVSGDSPEVSWL